MKPGDTVEIDGDTGVPRNGKPGFVLKAGQRYVVWRVDDDNHMVELQDAKGQYVCKLRQNFVRAIAGG